MGDNILTRKMQFNIKPTLNALFNYFLVITCFKLNDNRLTAKTPPHPLKTPVYKKNQQGKNRKLNSKF